MLVFNTYVFQVFEYFKLLLKLNFCLKLLSYSSTVYRDYEGLGFLAVKYHPKNQLIIYFLISWFGIAKIKNVFRSTINPSTKFFKNILFLLTD